MPPRLSAVGRDPGVWVQDAPFDTDYFVLNAGLDLCVGGATARCWDDPRTMLGTADQGELVLPSI